MPPSASPYHTLPRSRTQSHVHPTIPTIATIQQRPPFYRTPTPVPPQHLPLSTTSSSPSYARHRRVGIDNTKGVDAPFAVPIAFPLTLTSPDPSQQPSHSIRSQPNTDEAFYAGVLTNTDDHAHPPSSFHDPTRKRAKTGVTTPQVKHLPQPPPPPPPHSHSHSKSTSPRPQALPSTNSGKVNSTSSPTLDPPKLATSRSHHHLRTPKPPPASTTPSVRARTQSGPRGPRPAPSPNPSASKDHRDANSNDERQRPLSNSKSFDVLDKGKKTPRMIEEEMRKAKEAERRGEPERPQRESQEADGGDEVVTLEGAFMDSIDPARQKAMQARINAFKAQFATPDSTAASDADRRPVREKKDVKKSIGPRIEQSPGPAASKRIENKAAYLVDSNPLAGQVSSYLKVPAVASFPAQSSSATRSEVSLLMPAAPKHVPIIPDWSNEPGEITRELGRLEEAAAKRSGQALMGGRQGMKFASTTNLLEGNFKPYLDRPVDREVIPRGSTDTHSGSSAGHTQESMPLGRSDGTAKKGFKKMVKGMFGGRG
ncbi:hypothetical protein SISNIDRAFT_470954 [Sistotremastrum niveocremeum HHB9708]|uniref:Pal1-domain-containing protein n=1 Tax=Sistotremastrum niveocremeum HHB9708 TaxID=1314777 RepID=A0A164N9J4_9AGAM|nr:hypothetical protein SISNIDRAFT_470954 [Sistotremastrum niveocremeum HHB9708]